MGERVPSRLARPSLMPPPLTTAPMLTSMLSCSASGQWRERSTSERREEATEATAADLVEQADHIRVRVGCCSWPACSSATKTGVARWRTSSCARSPSSSCGSCCATKDSASSSTAASVPIAPRLWGRPCAFSRSRAQSLTPHSRSVSVGEPRALAASVTRGTITSWSRANCVSCRGLASCGSTCTDSARESTLACFRGPASGAALIATVAALAAWLANSAGSFTSACMRRQNCSAPSSRSAPPGRCGQLSTAFTTLGGS
mmetsp:Transcript_51936/g.124844  ORF Transcript_51936/g.124844 Transcript_51936/m.124844 type:complete len:260 (+) Transcript_51936:305-1084(+)